MVNIVKRSDDVTIDTTDNVSIKENELYYNESNANFDDKIPEKFENGKKITNEGYYKIVAIDTSGNKTEIIVLLDKSAPEVTVQFLKKNQVSYLDVFKNGGVIC